MPIDRLATNNWSAKNGGAPTSCASSALAGVVLNVPAALIACVISRNRLPTVARGVTQRATVHRTYSSGSTAHRRTLGITYSVHTEAFEGVIMWTRRSCASHRQCHLVLQSLALRAYQLSDGQ